MTRSFKHAALLWVSVSPASSPCAVPGPSVSPSWRLSSDFSIKVNPKQAFKALSDESTFPFLGMSSSFMSFTLDKYPKTFLQIKTFNQNKYYDANLLIDVFRIFRMSAYFKVKGWFKFLPLHFITSNNTPTFDASCCRIKSNERAPNEINHVLLIHDNIDFGPYFWWFCDWKC